MCRGAVSIYIPSRPGKEYVPSQSPFEDTEFLSWWGYGLVSWTLPPPPKTNVTKKIHHHLAADPKNSFIPATMETRVPIPQVRTRVMLVNSGLYLSSMFLFHWIHQISKISPGLGFWHWKHCVRSGVETQQISTGHLGKWWSRQCSGISGETMEILEIQWKKYRRVTNISPTFGTFESMTFLFAGGIC